MNILHLTNGKGDHVATVDLDAIHAERSRNTSKNILFRAVSAERRFHANSLRRMRRSLEENLWELGL